MITKVSEVELKYNYKCSPSTLPLITCSKEIYTIFKDNWADDLEYRERFYVMLLNRSNKVLGISNLSAGSCTGTTVDIKMILQVCLKANAQAFVIAHNHPSGSLNPSDADKKMTKVVYSASKLLDIILLDHIIMTSEGYYSFCDNGNLIV